MAAGIALVATVVWGLRTGNPMSDSVPAFGPPCNIYWGAAVVITYLGGGAFFAIAIGWPLVRKRAPIQADLYLGTVVLLVAGAIAWGARLGDFTMFYLFFAGIAVFATPVAAIAIRTVWERLQAARNPLAIGLVVLCALQLGLGVSSGVVRLQAFGPHAYGPISVSLLKAIRQLPPNAKLAYACQPFEEIAFTNPQLLSIDAHTGRRVVPMCFEAETLSTLIGATFSAQIPNAGFNWAPQRILYPDAIADPSSAAVTDFLKDKGIGYIYADASHPNFLVDDAVPIAKSGDAEVLRVP